MPDVNLNPYTAEQRAIDQRRKLAEMLQAQAMKEEPVNQMAGGYVVPIGKYSALAKMLQVGLSGLNNFEADKRTKELADKQKSDVTSDYSALISALRPREAIPAPSDELGGGPGREAMPATGITPELIGGLKTPDSQKLAMTLAAQQFAPKTLIKKNAEEGLYDASGKEVVAPGKKAPEYGTTPHYEINPDGTKVAVYADKHGGPALRVPANPMNQFTTPTAEGIANRAQRQQQWENLSAAQKQDFEIRGRQLGISGTELYFNTGMQPPGNPVPIQGAVPQGIPAQPQAPAVPIPSPQAPAQPIHAPRVGGTGATIDVNNPGGLRPVGASTGFQRFDTPEQGMAAIAGNLKAYGQKGINTIEKIVSTWAPSNENNTQAYIRDVSQRLGIPPNQPLDMNNPYVLQALTTAIMIKEQGPNLLFASKGAQQPNPASTAMTPKTAQAAALNAANQRVEMEQKREFNMSGLGETIDSAKDILKGKNTPTNSMVGTGVDWLGSVVGVAPKGAAEADRLRTIGGVLVAKMPRMEGPQSDKDVLLYREMAGRVGDSTLPIERRIAALDEVENLWRKYDKTATQPRGRGASGTWGDSSGWSIKRVN